MRIVSLLTLGLLAAAAENDSGDIRAVLRDLNEMVRKREPRSFRSLFTPAADYRDAAGRLKGPDTLFALFTSRQVWSERTPPILQDESIKFVGSSAALVDAQLIQYGSIIVKWTVPVVLLLEKEPGAWKISSWRMLGCPAPLPPAVPGIRQPIE